MKKYTVIAIAAICLAASHAKAATFTINFGMGALRDQNGAIVNNNIMVIAVADTSGLGLAGLTNQLTASTPLTAGSLIGGGSGDFVLTLNANGTTTGGYESGAVNGQDLSGALVTGQNVYILWFPSLTTAATTVGAGTFYGVFGGAQASPFSIGEGGSAWTVPAGGATVFMYADDAANFGSVPQASLTAAFQTAAVPEPSSIALVGVGLLGLVGLVRRRRS